MRKLFSIILKVLGYLLLAIMVIGGGSSFLRNSYVVLSSWDNFFSFLVALLFYLVPAILCIWGSNKLKNKNQE